ncbi:MAG TPA: CIA30 family protein [Pontiella sp.]|nr:CIA30 family protein [Pontiella sp.]
MEPQLMTVNWTRKEIMVAGFVNGIVMGAFGGSMSKRESGQWDDWIVVNDDVMGGLSQSRPEVTSSGTLIFSGNLSLENNGGFASIRHTARPFELDRALGIRLRVKGDGKKYQLRVRTSDRFDGIAYKADFETKKGVWIEFRFRWNVFTATFRGRTIADAPALKPLNIRQIGFLIADKQEGAFELEIQTLEAF